MIVCIGNACVDVLARPIDRFPPRGETVMFDELTVAPGGNCVNSASVLAMMGLDVAAIFKVGEDMFGQFILERLRRRGVGCDHVARSRSGRTSFTFVAVDSAGERSFFHQIGTNKDLSLQDVEPELLKRAELVLVTGTSLLPALDGEPTGKLLAMAKAGRAVTVLDTGISAEPKDYMKLLRPVVEHLDYFIPSMVEARRCTGQDEPDAAIKHLRAAGFRNVVIKLGPRGALLSTGNQPPTLVPARKVERVVDTTGAGDCWAAGFCAAISMGWHPQRAVELANLLASYTIQSTGAVANIPTLRELLEQL